MDKTKRQERSQQASLLLDNPLFNECFDSVSAEAAEALMQAEAGSLTAMRLHVKLQALREIKQAISSIKNDGKFV